VTHWPLVALIWVAFLIRTLHLEGQSLWRDEVDAIRFSSWSLPELLSGLTRTGHNGPLFFLGLRPWRLLTGDTEFALRYPSALLGALAVPLGFSLARQLGFSRATGLLLGLLLATSPYLTWYGQEAKMYALLLVLVTLAFIAYLKALSGAGRSWWLIFTVITSLSFYIHILAPLMLIVYGAAALCLYPQLQRQKWPWLISMSCLTLPYLPLALWQAGFLLEGTSPGHPFYPLQREFYLLLQLYSRGLIPFRLGLDLFETVPIVLFIFLFLCGLFLPAHPVGALASTQRTILASWALLPPLVVYLISLRIPVFEDRYLIYIVPPFYLLVALGLTLLRAYSNGLASLGLIFILTINFTGLWQQQSRPIKADFRAAATYLSKQSPPPETIMIQMPYLQYTFAYYYPKPYQLLEGIWTNGGKPEVELQREMTQMTANLTDLWLIVSEEEMWDERQMVRRWLDEHAQRVDEAHFTRVDLYHYQFPER
jgi:mannosyltransferase